MPDWASQADLDRDYCHWTVEIAATAADFAGPMLDSAGSAGFADSGDFSFSHSLYWAVCCPFSTSSFGFETIF